MITPSITAYSPAMPQFGAKDPGRKKAKKAEKRKKKLADRKTQKPTANPTRTTGQGQTSASTPVPVIQAPTVPPTPPTPTPTPPPVRVSATPSPISTEPTLPVLPAITRREHPTARQVSLEPLEGLTRLVPIGGEGRFNGGTMQESHFFRNPAVIRGVAQKLLQRFPLLRETPVQIRAHGTSDGREVTSLLLALSDEHIHANRPDIVPVNDTNETQIRDKEAEVIRQLGRQFRITSVEKNPSLVRRAQTGVYELAHRDLANIEEFERVAGRQTLDARMLTNGAYLDSGDPQKPFYMTSSPLLWSKGDMKVGDAFDDATAMPAGQAAVFSRNLLSYAVTAAPQRIGGYVRTIRDKLLPKGLLVLGEIDAQNRFSFLSEPIRDALRSAGLRPVPDSEIPHVVAPANAGYTSGPLVYTKDE